MRPLSRAAVARSSGRYTFSRAIHTLYTQGAVGRRAEKLSRRSSHGPSSLIANGRLSRSRESLQVHLSRAIAILSLSEWPIAFAPPRSMSLETITRATASSLPRSNCGGTDTSRLASPARAIVCSPHAEVFTQRTPSTSQNPPPRCLRWGVCHLKDYTLFGARSVDAATTSPTANAPPRLAGATPRRQSLSKQPSAW